MSYNHEAQAIRLELNHIRAKLEYGCGNHGCLIREPRALGTNGSCTCSPRRLAARLLDVAADLEKLPVDKLRIDE